MQISGLTGDVSLNPTTGDRPGFFGFICVTDPWDPVAGAQIASVSIMREKEKKGKVLTRLRQRILWWAFRVDNHSHLFIDHLSDVHIFKPLPGNHWTESKYDVIYQEG